MIKINNVVSEVDDGKHRQRDPTALNRIAVHRCGVDLYFKNIVGFDAVAICNAFAGRDPKWPDVAKATGGEIPYTFLIGGDLGPPDLDGVIWQCLPVYEIGAHARRWNATALGVCVIGDPRFKACSPTQRQSLIALLADLCQAFKINVEGVDAAGVPFLAGHDELPGGFTDPNKRCPGKLLPMADVRHDVAEAIKTANKAEAMNRLIAAGLTT